VVLFKISVATLFVSYDSGFDLSRTFSPSRRVTFACVSHVVQIRRAGIAELLYGVRLRRLGFGGFEPYVNLEGGRLVFGEIRCN
jgi:hypothetical protein